MGAYDQLFDQAAKDNNLDPLMLRGYAQAESSMNPQATSYDDNGKPLAKGIMQLVDSTAQSLGVKDPYDPKQAIPAAAKLIRQNLDASGGDEKAAMMMYHGGPDRSKWGPKTAAYPDRVYGAMAKLMSQDMGDDPVAQFLSSGGTQTGSAKTPDGGTSDPVMDFFQSGKIQPATSQNNGGEGGSEFLHGVAGLADSAWGVVPAVMGTAAYATRRALGDTPEQATQNAQTATAWADRPFGKAFGVTNTSGYQNEASQRLQGFIGENLDKGADWLAQHTGLPKADVQNMMQSAMMGTPEAANIVAPYLKSAKNAVVDSVKAQANPSVATAARTAASPSSYDQARASYSMPATGASIGAAAAATPDMARAMVSNSSSPLQAQVEQALKSGEPLNKDVLERHIQADSLPVPIRLTLGQATQDPTIISKELNNRAIAPGMVDHLKAQADALKQNLQAIRDQAAPDVYAPTLTDHGNIIIKAYQELDDSLNKDIASKYKALEDANGGSLPIDTGELAGSVAKELQKRMKTNHLSPAIKTDFQQFLDNPTFEQFEALRTNLADEMRSAQNGNARQAARIVREQLENMPLSEDAANLKQLADSARTAARNRFQLMEQDPAYRSVVNGKANADNFVNQYITGRGASSQNVQAMFNNLGHDPVAQQAMASSVMHMLGEKSGIINGNGNFSQAMYNRGLNSIRSKLPIMFDASSVRNLSNLGDVANYTQFQPRGSFVNNSNTLTAFLANHAKNSAEFALNMKAPGLGTFTRNWLDKRAAEGEMNQHLSPGAGITNK